MGPPLRMGGRKEWRNSAGGSRRNVLASVSEVKGRLVGRCVGRYFRKPTGKAARAFAHRGPAKEKSDDVDRNRGRHAAPRASVLHHAGDRGQEERRARARGGG